MTDEKLYDQQPEGRERKRKERMRIEREDTEKKEKRKKTSESHILLVHVPNTNACNMKG